MDTDYRTYTDDKTVPELLIYYITLILDLVP